MNECISKNEILLLAASGERIQIVDVRSKEEYEDLHIEGTINIPIETIETQLDKLKGTELIITACDKGGRRSTKAAQLLKENGKNVNWLCGGTIGWFEN